MPSRTPRAEPLSSGDGRVRLAPAFTTPVEEAPAPERPDDGGAAGPPRPLFELPTRARIVKSRFGYYAHVTHGVARVGEVPSFSFSRRGIERKVRRIARQLERDDARQAAAEDLVL